MSVLWTASTTSLFCKVRATIFLKYLKCPALVELRVDPGPHGEFQNEELTSFCKQNRSLGANCLHGEVKDRV
jgi:hypothetical protein